MPGALPSVVVLDDWEHSLARLVDWPEIRRHADVTIHSQPLQGEALLQAMGGAQCVVLFRDRTPVDAQLLARLPALRQIISTGTRNQKLDSEAARARGIEVRFTEWGPSKASTTEMAWSLILGCARRLPQLQLQPGRSAWRREDAFELLPRVLEGKTLGLVGLGQIGQRVAAVGRAFGMEVLTWSPNMTPERAAPHGARAVSLDALLRSSQVVSLHLVPSGATRHLLGAENLAKLQKEAILVNTSRAELIDMPALVQALQARTIGMAGLDVFEHEPLAPDHPLLALDNVLLTSHYGFVCKEVLSTFAAGVTAGLLEFLEPATVQ